MRRPTLTPSATLQTTGLDLYKTGGQTKRKTQMESTDLYQNFRGKTTICERITDVAYEIADTDPSATEQTTARRKKS